MSDLKPSDGRASGRWLAALIALAFVAGLTLMGYGARRWDWFATAPSTPVRVVAAPVTAEPAPAAIPATIVTGTDPVTLATREATLAGQLTALEARTATLTNDAAAAGNQAARGEALLVVAAARRQLDAGLPLGYLEEQLRQRLGQAQPRGVTTLIAAARQPVTLDQLAVGLDLLRPRLMSGPRDDVLDGLRRELATLVVLRRAGTPSPLPVDRLAHARRLIAGAQVDAARAEIAALPGAAAATGWLAAARRWVLAHQALDALEAAALTVPPVIQPTAAPGTTTSTTVLP